VLLALQANPVKPLLFLWFLFIASASFWLPAYMGEIDGAEITFLPVYAAVAVLAAISVRGREQSPPKALLSALSTLALLGAAAGGGLLLNEQKANERGEPIFLYFGVALWASWAALVLSAALVSRTRWNGIAGIGLGLLVAALGLFLFTVRID
jgi:hypothetical protein